MASMKQASLPWCAQKHQMGGKAVLATKFMDLASRVWPAAHAQEVLDLTVALG